MSRQHGFTCPNCGNREFGTFTYDYRIPVFAKTKKYPDKVDIGQCHSYQHRPSECRYEWNRADPVKEKEAIYTMTEEEWADTYKNTAPKN